MEHVGNIYTAINACKVKAKEDARQRKEAKAQAGNHSGNHAMAFDSLEESKEEAKETRMLEWKTAKTAEKEQISIAHNNKNFWMKHADFVNEV